MAILEYKGLTIGQLVNVRFAVWAEEWGRDEILTWAQREDFRWLTPQDTLLIVDFWSPFSPSWPQEEIAILVLHGEAIVALSAYDIQFLWEEALQQEKQQRTEAVGEKT